MENKTRFSEKFHEIEKFRYCEQCGRCSSACPLTGINDFNIRRVIRFVELDLIEELAGSVKPWFCATCGRCQDACPNGIKILDIIRELRVVWPDSMIPDGPPCVKACPANINIPEYLRLIAVHKPEQAYQLIMENAPFPGVLGRVCSHPCEAECKRGQINEPISICALKRYAADNTESIPEKVFKVEKSTDHKVAIIGSGPAGLTAAFFLRKKGHSITVFEAREKPGGMMRYGIPDYRLPEHVLDKEINQILKMGIEIKTGQKFRPESDIQRLTDQGFESVFIAIGAQLSKKIQLQGKELNHVLWGLDFLTAINQGEKIVIKENLIVIGGGNVAIDVSLSALRMGAKNVTMVCLENKENIPADPWEIQMASEEGVQIFSSWGPDKILHENGKVSGVEFLRCTSVFDDKGSFCPCFDNTKKIIKADQVILAIGQSVETDFCSSFSFLNSAKTLSVKNGFIEINHKTQQTSIPGVFAGGDAVNGSAGIIHAIAAGKMAAKSIDTYLCGDGIIDSSNINSEQDYNGIREHGFADQKRELNKKLEISKRDKNFYEVNLCFDNDQAIKEASRCLQCDLEQELATGAKS